MNRCPRCGEALAEGILVCPVCETNIEQKAQTGTVPVAQDLLEQVPDTNAAFAADTEPAAAAEYVPPIQESAMKDAVPTHPSRPKPKSKSKKMNSKKIIRIAGFSLLGLVVVFAAITLLVNLLTDDGLEGASLPGPLRRDIRSLLNSGDAQAYAFYEQADTALGLPAYRALLPNGWRVTGKVTWNGASTAYPALFTMQATSEDGRARLSSLSEMQFVEYRGDDSPYFAAKTAPRETRRYPNRFVMWFMEGRLGMEELLMYTSFDLDPGKKIQERYVELLRPLAAEYEAQGIRLTDPSLTYTQLQGSVIFNQEDYDAEAYVLMYHYVLRQDEGGILTVWGTLGLDLYIAPKGSLEDYLPDLRFISANLNVNKDWFSAREAASRKFTEMIQRGELKDYEALGEDPKPLIQAAKQAGGGTDYSPAKQSIYLETWKDLMLDMPRYRLEDGAMAAFPAEWTKLWLNKNAEDGDVYLGVKDPEFKPSSGLTWVELEKE